MSREVLRVSTAHQTSLHYVDKKDYAIIYAYPSNRIYKPSGTGAIFHDDDSFVRLVMGPYGSGKSTMCIQEIVRRARRMPAWSNGRRRSRWAVVRNTVGELYSTTLQTWLMWFSELGNIRKRQKPILTYEHEFNDGDGVIELEVIFLAFSSLEPASSPATK